MRPEDNHARLGLQLVELWLDDKPLVEVPLPFIPPMGCEVIVTGSDRPDGRDFYRVIDVSFEFHIGRVEASPPIVRVILRRADPSEPHAREGRIRVSSRSRR